MELTRKDVTSKLTAELNWCSDTLDCAGQRIHALGLMCMKGTSYHTVCDTGAHACFTKCLPTDACKDCGAVCVESGGMCPMIEFPPAIRACYDKATCGRDANGACGWIDQPRVDACIADAK